MALCSVCLFIIVAVSGRQGIVRQMVDGGARSEERGEGAERGGFDRDKLGEPHYIFFLK